MDNFRKSFEATIDEINPGSREVVAIISTDAVDRDGEVLVPKGLRKKNYGGITVDLNHDHDKVIGSCKWVKAEPNRVIAKYRVSDKTELARDTFGLLQDGVFRFHSVEGRGFDAGKPSADEIRLNKSWGSAKRIVRDWEMFGFAVCAQPVNPDAVALLVAKGYGRESLAAIFGEAAPETPSPVTDTIRDLTSGEAVVALSRAIASARCVSMAELIAKSFARAGGKLD